MDIEVSVDGGNNFSLVVDDLNIIDGNADANTGAPNSATFQFVSNGSDDIHIRFTNVGFGNAPVNGSGVFTLVNGFQVNVVPEPSSLAFLGFSGLLIARRRW